MPSQAETDTILVVAFTQGVAAAASQTLQRQLPAMPRPCRIVTLAFEQVDVDLELDGVLMSGSLRACVFALERGGFEEPAKTRASRGINDPDPWALGDWAEPDRRGYRSCLEFMAGLVMARADFRLFVIPPGDDPGLVKDLTTPGSPSFSPVAVTMQECVNLPREGEPIPEDYPGPQLAAFLEDLPDIQDARLYGRLRMRADRLAGGVATAVQLSALAVIGTLLGWCALSGQLMPTTALPLPTEALVASALAAGITLCPAVVVALAARSSTPDSNTAPYSTQVGWIAVVLLSAAALYATFFIVFPGMPTVRPWFWVATGMGVLLDHGRRTGWKRGRVTIPSPSATTPPEPRSLGALLKIPRAGPLSGALLSPTKPKVFISYTHKRGWSERNAELLKQALAEADVKGFIDRMIPHGSSWREAIDRGHGDATTFCVLLDRDCLDSAWIAAELRAAADNQGAGGGPDIYLILDPALDIPTRGTHLEADLRGPLYYGRAVYVVEGNPDEFAHIARYLGRSGYLAGGGALSKKLQALAWGAIGIPLIVLQSIGAQGTRLFWLALPLLCALLLGLDQRWSSLASHSVALWGYLVSAFFTAFVMRLTVASRFEMHIASPDYNGRIMWIMHAAMAFVFFDLAGYWGRALDPIHVAWGLVIGGFAWHIARYYSATMRSVMPQLRRAVT